MKTVSKFENVFHLLTKEVVKLPPCINPLETNVLHLHTAQIMQFSIKDFSSKCDQIRTKLRILYLVIWSCLLKKPLMENFIFCAVTEKR